ncbi:hypothetical protein COEREDRAFT_6391 [Coemansia reversa NRRL 1564]|uniref:Uncharacterized protein n=1 Tax=Coemansia reversa (strain ATCC 12441 / NRRL 1564) TaxID=763665 RepID=A0A2G5BI57_COERN|nr:hypothetical protein COEREDRAFT_6391 [Coemansia reversa NRRL 1564]|eukprot:PIA18683.1 hypothetical protein COEREDRAFT_6391 [Coemansia reversa NRRL 1564]
MEERVGHLERQLLEAQKSVQQLMERDTVREAQLRSLQQTILDVFQQAVIKLEQLPALENSAANTSLLSPCISTLSTTTRAGESVSPKEEKPKKHHEHEPRSQSKAETALASSAPRSASSRIERVVKLKGCVSNDQSRSSAMQTSAEAAKMLEKMPLSDANGKSNHKSHSTKRSSTSKLRKCVLDDRIAVEDGQMSEDNISLYPSEEKGARSLKSSSRIQRSPPPVHYNPVGWMGDDDDQCGQPSPKRESRIRTRSSDRSRDKSGVYDKCRSHGGERSRSRSRSHRESQSRREDRHYRSPSRDRARRHRSRSRSSSRHYRSRQRAYSSRPRSRSNSGSRVSKRRRSQRKAFAEAKRDTSHEGWIIEDAESSHGPVMPMSVSQIIAGPSLPSSADKVLRWNNSAVADAPIRRSASPASSESIGEAAAASVVMGDASDNEIGLDNSDDSDGSMIGLGTRKQRAELAGVQLRDADDVQLTPERSAPLWGLFGWVPLEGLPARYRHVYRAELWTVTTRRQVRSLLKSAAWLEPCELGGEVLLFRKGNHLGSARRSDRLFVDRLVPEPLLFFFLVTTVLRPLDYAQGPDIQSLWFGHFERSPLHLRTIVNYDEWTGQVRWTEIAPLWKTAVDWLRRLADAVVELGAVHVGYRIMDWSYERASRRAKAAPAQPTNPQPDSATPDDLDALVFGLHRDELAALLSVTPLLLAGIMSSSDIDKLELGLEN